MHRCKQTDDKEAILFECRSVALSQESGSMRLLAEILSRPAVTSQVGAVICLALPTPRLKQPCSATPIDESILRVWVCASELSSMEWDRVREIDISKGDMTL